MSSSCSSPSSAAPALHSASKVYQVLSILRRKKSRGTLLQRSRTPTRRNSCACHFAKVAPAGSLLKACDLRRFQTMKIQSCREVRSRGLRMRETQVRESRAVVLMRFAPFGVGVRVVACPICGLLNYDRRMSMYGTAITIAGQL